MATFQIFTGTYWISFQSQLFRVVQELPPGKTLIQCGVQNIFLYFSIRREFTRVSEIFHKVPG